MVDIELNDKALEILNNIIIENNLKDMSEAVVFLVTRFENRNSMQK